MPDDACHLAVLTERVDTISREFVNELKETNKLICILVNKVDSLESDKAKVQGFLAGVVFLATGIGGVGTVIIQHISGWKITW